MSDYRYDLAGLTLLSRRIRMNRSSVLIIHGGEDMPSFEPVLRRKPLLRLDMDVHERHLIGLMWPVLLSPCAHLAPPMMDLVRGINLQFNPAWFEVPAYD